MSDPACIFCKIAEGAIPASVVHSSERLVAFRDIDAKAPVHILVIPREHLASLDATDERHRALLGEILLLARHLARDEGLAERGYRTVINTGAEAGQSVHHLHLHLLGGRALGWPPG
jgi:histidine triad (HIT) family protein